MFAAVQTKEIQVPALTDVSMRPHSLVLVPSHCFFWPTPPEQRKASRDDRNAVLHPVSQADKNVSHLTSIRGQAGMSELRAAPAIPPLAEVRPVTRQAGIRDVCRDKLHEEDGAARSAYALNTCWEWISPLDPTAQSWSAAAMSQSSPWGVEDMGTHCAHMGTTSA